MRFEPIKFSILGFKIKPTKHPGLEIKIKCDSRKINKQITTTTKLKLIANLHHSKFENTAED